MAKNGGIPFDWSTHSKGTLFRVHVVLQAFVCIVFMHDCLIILQNIFFEENESFVLCSPSGHCLCF